MQPCDALRPYIALSHALTDRWRHLASCSAGVAVCFVWAFGEATVWPVIPDVALFLLIVAVPRRAPRLLLATVAGATVGGAVTLVMAALAPQIWLLTSPITARTR